MFPIVAIGGVIGAVFSIAKGASWLSDQLDSSNASASVGGKGDGKTETGSSADTQTSQFEAALAAQVAGQNQPAAAVTGTTTSSTATSATGGANAATMSVVGATYDPVARMKAGLIAYSQVGANRDDQSTASQATASRS